MFVTSVHSYFFWIQSFRRDKEIHYGKRFAPFVYVWLEGGATAGLASRARIMTVKQ